MKRAILAASLVFLSVDVFPSLVLAQSNAPTSARAVSTCSSGLRGGGANCAPERRLLIVVTLNGAEAPARIRNVVDAGASAGGAFALDSRDATARDSAAYGVIDVKRDAQGNYRVDQRATGSLFKSRDNCRGSSTGRLDDMGFGAYLALQTQQFVRCVQNSRGVRR
jgi:hypothetical protein